MSELSPVTKNNNDSTFVRFKRNAGATAAAGAGAALLYMSSAPISNIAKTGIFNASKDLTSAQKTTITQKAREILKMTGLSKDGVKIHDLREIPKNDEFIKGQSETVKKLYTKASSVYQTARGENAFYTAFAMGKYGNETIGKNEILVNTKKLPAVIFHETGHAMNNNKSLFWKNMQRFGSFSTFITLGMILYGVFSKESKPENKRNRLTPDQKANNFIRKHLGKIAVAACIPSVLEEMKASSYANSWAKELLNPETAKSVLKSNRLGLISHIAAACAAGLAANGAVKIKDYVLRKSEEKSLDCAKKAHQG